MNGEDFLPEDAWNLSMRGIEGIDDDTVEILWDVQAFSV